VTELLFELPLEYNPDMPPVHLQGKVGEYIGSGVGEAIGDGLRGQVRWTLFEDVSEALCQSNLFGVITTDDGAEIRFDSLGYFYIPDKDHPKQWKTSAAVHFSTDDERYDWLADTLASWQGSFDMEAYQHHYKVFVDESLKA
jgi:hypothetical protein